MTTPPNPPPYGEDNPYGSQPPAGQTPYGSGQNPYGAQPYPGGPAGYGGQPEAKTDGVSIAALVTGVLCCAPVGIVLGILGIRRTKDGQRKGRWAAITGIVLGALGILAWVGVVAGGLWIFNNAVTPGNAEVGQCVNIDTEDGEVSMLKKECSEDHDGEIVAVEELSSDSAADAQEQQVAYCAELLSDEDFATIIGNDEIELSAVFEDPENVEDGDHILCYVEATSGKLDEKILD